jgi:hypothetical protein
MIGNTVCHNLQMGQHTHTPPQTQIQINNYGLVTCEKYSILRQNVESTTYDRLKPNKANYKTLLVDEVMAANNLAVFHYST